MAQEAPNTETPKAAAGAEAKAGISIKKLVMIGVPVFVVQLAVLFFVATKFIGGGSSSHAEPAKEAAAAESHEEGKEAESHGEGEGEGAPSKMYVVKDLIVNPAGTNGSRYLLTTIGLETSSTEASKELEKKEIQVRDALNSILTSKGLEELAPPEAREALRGEIQTKVGSLLKSGSIANVYFSKFIIQ